MCIFSKSESRFASVVLDSNNYFEDVGGLLGPYLEDLSKKRKNWIQGLSSGDIGFPMGTRGAKNFFRLKVHKLSRCPCYNLFVTFPTFAPTGTWFLGHMTSHFLALWLGGNSFEFALSKGGSTKCVQGDGGGHKSLKTACALYVWPLMKLDSWN